MTTASPLLLLDKSAYVRGAGVQQRQGDLCLCAVTRLELLYSARSSSDFEQLEGDLAAFRDLRMDAATFDTALAAQRELALRSQHRVPIPDVLVAACAAQHGADVIHVDRHYEVLASVLSFRALRLEPSP